MTIGSRFFFTFFLGKQFSEEVLGQYGLFATSILLVYFVISFSFDSYGLRAILQKPEREQGAYIRNHFVFYLTSYVIFVGPIALIFLTLDILPAHLLPYFLVLLLLETLNQTFFALFAILQKSLTANIILFFSQASWILIIFSIWFLLPELLVFETFLVAWICGGLFTVGYALFQLRKLYASFSLGKIDWAWIKGGIAVSLIFFCSTLSYKLIEFTDRYFIEGSLGLSQLGIYVFYSQIANLINTVINTMVILMLYPKLITSYINHDVEGFLIIRKKMYLRVFGLGVCLALGEVLLIEFLLQWLGKKSFEQEISTFYILLLSNIIMNLSFVPHYCLYALKKDMQLLYTTIIGAVINILLNSILIPKIGISGAAISALCSFLAVWLSKAFALKNNLTLIKNES